MSHPADVLRPCGPLGGARRRAAVGDELQALLGQAFAIGERELAAGSPAAVALDAVPQRAGRRRRPRRPVAAVGAEHVLTDDCARAAHANGMSYLDLVRRSARPPGAARRGRPARRPRPGRRRPARLLGARRGGRAVRRRHERRRRRGARSAAACGGHRARPAPPGPSRRGRRRLLDGDAAGRRHGPARGGAARRAGLHPRPRPPVASSARRSAATPRRARPASSRPAGGASTRSSSACARSTPAGDLDLGRAPGTAAGPDLRQLLLGSEGALAVITEVTVRVRPLPEIRRHEGWRVPDLATGITSCARWPSAAPRPDLARLSDETETALGVATGGATHEAGGCLLLVGWEGFADDVGRRAAAATDVLERARAPRRWATRPRSPGGTGASAPRACATSSSARAWSSRRWRRPPRGAS